MSRKTRLFRKAVECKSNRDALNQIKWLKESYCTYRKAYFDRTSLPPHRRKSENEKKMVNLLVDGIITLEKTINKICNRSDK